MRGSQPLHMPTSMQQLALLTLIFFPLFVEISDQNMA